MKHSIVIRCVKGTQGGWLNLESILYKGTEYCITKKLVPVDRTKMMPSDEPLLLRITPDKSYNLSYDDDLKGDGVNDTRKLMAELLPYHPQIITEGFQNPNSGLGQLFEFEDLAKTDIKNFTILSLMRSATNKIWNMSYREKMDTAFFYGENPSGMGHRELTMRLAEPNYGIILKRVPFGSSGKTYLEHFSQVYDKGDSMQQFKTIVLKAMVITRNGYPLIRKEGNAYMFGEKVIGASVEDCMTWFASNPEMKKFVEDQVSELDSLLPDDFDLILQGDGESAIEQHQKSQDIDALRKKAKSLRISNWHGKKADKLIPEIEHAEKVWQRAELFGLKEKIDSMSGYTLAQIETLVANKEKEVETA